MEMISIEILGFAAGATTLISSVPQLIANLRNQDLARGQSLARNCLQSAGNALWFIYGASVGSTSMVTFAGLGCLMATCLALQTHRVQRDGLVKVDVQPSSQLGVPAT
ncbi:MAG: PQ-loop domain-containing transporter [Hyphomicrobiales bacterium]